MIVVYRFFTVGLIVVLMDGKYEMIQRCGTGDEVTAGDGGQEMGVKKVSGNTKINAARILYAFFCPFYYVCFFLFSPFFFLVARMRNLCHAPPNFQKATLP